MLLRVGRRQLGGLRASSLAPRLVSGVDFGGGFASLARHHRRLHESTSSRRVLCSLQELQALNGRGLKFDLTKPLGAKKSKRFADTGFVFMCDFTNKPRAFENRCPHANVELDLDDSDFFDNGFILCKVHGAMFDPETGECLRGVHGGDSRRSIRPLKELQVVVENDQVILLEELRAVKATRTTTEALAIDCGDGTDGSSACGCHHGDAKVDSSSPTSQDKHERLQQQQAIKAREIQQLQDEIDRKARERIQLYKELDAHNAARVKK